MGGDRPLCTILIVNSICPLRNITVFDVLVPFKSFTLFFFFWCSCHLLSNREMTDFMVLLSSFQCLSLILGEGMYDIGALTFQGVLIVDLFSLFSLFDIGVISQ